MLHFNQKTQKISKLLILSGNIPSNADISFFKVTCKWKRQRVFGINKRKEIFRTTMWLSFSQKINLLSDTGCSTPFGHLPLALPTDPGVSSIHTRHARKTYSDHTLDQKSDISHVGTSRGRDRITSSSVASYQRAEVWSTNHKFCT